MNPADIIAVHRANVKANENRNRENAKPFLAEMKAKIDELTKQNAELKTNESELQEDIHNLEAEIAARVEEIETYKAQIAELEQKLAAATAKKGAKK